MSFWGVSVKPNTTKSTVIPDDCGLTLYTVALKEGQVAKFSITINGEEYFIATLIKDVFPQHKIRFDIPPSSEIVFKCVSDTNATIDITGALISLPEEDEDDFDEDEFDEDEFDEDEDDEDDEDDDEEEEEEAPKKKVEASKKKAEAPKKEQQPPQKKAKADDGKKFKCSACDKVFGSEQGRDAHFAAKHK